MFGMTVSNCNICILITIFHDNCQRTTPYIPKRTNSPVVLFSPLTVPDRCSPQFLLKCCDLGTFSKSTEHMLFSHLSQIKNTQRRALLLCTASHCFLSLLSYALAPCLGYERKCLWSTNNNLKIGKRKLFLSWLCTTICCCFTIKKQYDLNHTAFSVKYLFMPQQLSS